PRDADGENVGIAKFGVDGASVLVDEMEKALEDGGKRDWLTRAFAGFSRRRRLHVVETRGYPWTEIDSPEDYWRACTEVLPAILKSESPRPASRGLPMTPAGRAGGLRGRV